MKLIKLFTLVIPIALIISSCGEEKQQAVINYGRDCDKTHVVELRRLIGVQEARDKQVPLGSFPTVSQFHWSYVAYMDVRSYVRGLDVPLLAEEQNAYVTVVGNFINAFQDYWDTQGYDLTVNDYVIPYNDAEQDFLNSFSLMCEFGLPVQQQQNTNEETLLPNEPYNGYSDGIDQDCADIRRSVYVGSNDPDGLDRDGDGWGCESYGG